MRGRQNWSEECENKLNEQINTELDASYAYMQIASYFMRQNVGVDKLVKYFSNASMEEREHAEKFIKYQNMRGGCVVFKPIKPTEISLGEQNDILEAFQITLKLEKQVNKKLLDLHDVADKKNDPQFQEFIESEFLSEQVEAIDKIAKIISLIKRYNGDQFGIINGIDLE